MTVYNILTGTAAVAYMEESKEQILVKHLLKKEEAAWKELFGAYSGNLSYVCSRYVTEKEDIHDVLQNSFIKMFRSIESFEYRGNGSLKAWMTRITVNESLKHIKQKGDFKSAVEVDDLPDIPNEEEPDFEEIPRDDIMKMIRSLPEGYRTVFNLFVFEKKAIKKLPGCWELQKTLLHLSFTVQKDCLFRK
ncbi:RNA polymerase sigma factor [Chryseobacterium sp. 1B4]